MHKRPELLAPGGSLQGISYALAYGADAVYAGHPSYSLRARNNDFTLEALAETVEYVHARDRKIYITSNIFPHNDKVAPYLGKMREVVAMKPDAVIMADPGLIMLVRDHWPDLPIHLSVQANTLNYASVEFWQRAGISRIILSRELSLDEIREIRERCPDIELEVFVHGAMCISFSGRCLLSGYFSSRDANQGTCANSCRWNYQLYLEESQRPGKLMPISEDENGTYILNSKDLCAIEYVNELVDIGIDSLKIEGRTKSHFYVARTTRTYRQAIEDAVNGKSFDPLLRSSLEGLANRGYTAGFLPGAGVEQTQNYETNHSTFGNQRFVGEVIGEEDGLLYIGVKNRFSVNEKLILLCPDGEFSFTLTTLLDRNREPVDVAPGSGHEVYINRPEGVSVEQGLVIADRR